MIPYAPAIYRNYLSTTLSVPVFPAKPGTRPPKCIVLQPIQASGTAKQRVFGWRRMLIHCWDSSDTTGDAAGLLGERIRQALVESPWAGLGVHRVVVLGEPGRYDDPREATPRFQLTVDVLMKDTPRLNIN